MAILWVKFANIVLRVVWCGVVCGVWSKNDIRDVCSIADFIDSRLSNFDFSILDISILEFRYSTFSTISGKFLKDFSNISRRYLEDFLKISRRFLEDIRRFLEDFSKISRRFLKDFSKISRRFLEDFSKNSRVGWDLCVG